MVLMVSKWANKCTFYRVHGRTGQARVTGKAKQEKYNVRDC